MNDQTGGDVHQLQPRGRLDVVLNKSQANAIFTGANRSGRHPHFRTGNIVEKRSLLRVLEGEENIRARKPAIVSDHVDTGRTDILDPYTFLLYTGPVRCFQIADTNASITAPLSESYLGCELSNDRHSLSSTPPFQDGPTDSCLTRGEGIGCLPSPAGESRSSPVHKSGFAKL